MTISYFLKRIISNDTIEHIVNIKLMFIYGNLEMFASDFQENIK